MNARWHVEWNLNKVTSSIIWLNNHKTLTLHFVFISSWICLYIPQQHSSSYFNFVLCIHVHVQWTKDTLIDPESITIFYVTVIKHWRAVLSKLYILNKYMIQFPNTNVTTKLIKVFFYLYKQTAVLEIF